MTHQPHLEAMKEQNAIIEMELSKVKAHCNYLREACHKIVTLDIDKQDESSFIAATAVKQTEEQSLAENNATEIEKLIYNPKPVVDFSLSGIEIVEGIKRYANKLRKLL